MGKIVASPCECSSCSDDIKMSWGCGLDDRYSGRAAVIMGWDVEQRTCPRYYVEHDRDVIEIMSDVVDYRRGTLGPVGSMHAHRVDYLRCASNVITEWSQKNGVTNDDH